MSCSVSNVAAVILVVTADVGSDSGVCLLQVLLQILVIKL